MPDPKMENPSFEVNDTVQLPPEGNTTRVPWVTKNTAILVVHGIGNQLPLETVDLFTRGLLKEYKAAFAGKISISHQMVPKSSDRNDIWFDNAVRINLEGSDKYIDVYEYYWANYTEEKASWTDLNLWLQGVVDGAEKFYEKNKQLGTRYSGKKSSFFTRNGEFRTLRYKFFIKIISKTFILFSLLSTAILKFFSYIPVIGEVASSLLKSFFNSKVHQLTNVIGDIVVYNVTDPKSKFYSVRRLILDGAVHALKYLVEKCDDQEVPVYESVIVAGHSLGSQVAYDAINKVSLLVNKNQVHNCNSAGLNLKTNISVSHQIGGFITFGSPLDKLAFFLREKVPDDLYIRQQLLENYHGFKQRNWSFNERFENDFTHLPQPISRIFDRIEWRNYFDKHDYVSGSLDYYMNLKNVDCGFESGTFGFTHSNYWECRAFYKDIIGNFLK